MATTNAQNAYEICAMFDYLKEGCECPDCRLAMQGIICEQLVGVVRQLYYAGVLEQSQSEAMARGLRSPFNKFGNAAKTTAVCRRLAE